MKNNNTTLDNTEACSCSPVGYEFILDAPPVLVFVVVCLLGHKLRRFSFVGSSYCVAAADIVGWIIVCQWQLLSLVCYHADIPGVVFSFLVSHILLLLCY